MAAHAAADACIPGLKDAVTAFAASPDGNTILTATADKIVTLGSVGNNQAAATFTGSKAAIQAVALSPDNDVSRRRAARMDRSALWGRQGKVKVELEAHPGGVSGHRVSPVTANPLYRRGRRSGEGLEPADRSQAAGGEGDQAHDQGRTPARSTALLIHPTTGQVITAGADKLIRIWDPANPAKAVRRRLVRWPRR